MDNFALIVEFDIKPDGLDKFKALIAENARDSVKNEPGCLLFDVCQDEANPNRIVLYEIYKDTAAFDAHREMAHVKKFFGAAKELIAGQKATRMKRISANA
jgi:(4S)-4-hydroxy-5-phosphonooxypentane-2,3-dione isomerase